MNYQRLVASLSNQDLQQEIEDNEKLQLENGKKVIDLIGVKAWNNISDYALPIHIDIQVKKLKAEDYKLTKMYMWLEVELDRRKNKSKFEY